MSTNADQPQSGCRVILLVVLVPVLALCGLLVGLHFSGGAPIAGVSIMLLWSVPLAIMLLTERPFGRPPRTSDSRNRIASRLRRYSHYAASRKASADESSAREDSELDSPSS